MSQHIQHRRICLTRAILYDALPPADPERFARLQTRKKRVNKSRFTDADFAQDEDGLTLANLGFVERAAQLL